MKHFVSLVLLAAVARPLFALTQSNNNAAVIDGSHGAEASLSYVNANPILEIDGQGGASAPKDFESIENLQVKAAYHVTPDYQFGVSIQAARRRSRGDQSLAFSDLNADVGYQLFSEPNVLIFAQAIYPASRSNYETENDVYQLDALGRGFWGVGTGLLATKDFGRSQVQVFADAHRSFPRDFANSENAGTLNPGWGGDFGAGVTYKVFAEFSVALGMEWIYEDPVEIAGREVKSNPAQRTLSVSAGITYQASEKFAYRVGYLDQTFQLNDSASTLLRALTLGIEESWP